MPQNIDDQRSHFSPSLSRRKFGDDLGGQPLQLDTHGRLLILEDQHRTGNTKDLARPVDNPPINQSCGPRRASQRPACAGALGVSSVGGRLRRPTHHRLHESRQHLTALLLSEVAVSDQPLRSQVARDPQLERVPTQASQDAAYGRIECGKEQPRLVVYRPSGMTRSNSPGCTSRHGHHRLRPHSHPPTASPGLSRGSLP